MNPVAAADGLFLQLELKQLPESDSDIGGCKAGNKSCSSLILEQEKQNSPFAPCDICCVESKFCRQCCCILCYKTVDSAYGGYSNITCNVQLGDDICGHVCHLEFALRSYSAGTVGGTIGLDAEYFCWRCDGRTELIHQANNLLQTCESIDTDHDGDIREKVLKLGICLERGSEKTAAKELMSRITLAMSKLKYGTNTEDILNVDAKITANSSGSSVVLQTVEERNEQLREELKKFEEMKKVANGFGSTSKEILEKHFGL